ncbi:MULTISPECIES: ABC transporter ATP-binding protein [Rhizobium]|nr:ABC transporter ATP-binding protein [Rhizobium rosettiformans]
MFSTVERGHLPMYSDNCVIHADNISKLYRKFERPEDRLKEWLFRGKRRYSSDFWALSGVSIDIDRGETVGIVGRNGSGKSTLLKLICGTVRPTTGTISVKGRISALLELGAGFNNEFTGRENIHLNASLLGLTPDEIAERMDRILAFAEIGSYIDQPVKYYSSGMFARLAFSVAVHVDPQILIIDEILAVGDMAFQRKCVEKIFQIKQSGCTILFVSHDAYQVKTICDRALYLKNGAPIGYGPASDIIDLYTYDVEKIDSFISLTGEMPVKDEHHSSTRDAERDVKPVAENDAFILDDAELRPAENGDMPPFEITSVHMVADGVASPKEIKSGARVEFTVRYRSLRHDAPKQGSFVFNLKRHDDFYVCGATTLMEKRPPYKLERQGEFQIIFPALNLLAGHYKIRFAINDVFGWGVLAERLEACIFQVKDTYVSHGLIDLPREWRVSDRGGES